MEQFPQNNPSHEKENFNIESENFAEKETTFHPEETNSYVEERKLVADEMSFEQTINNSIEKTKDPYLKALGDILLENKSFIENKKAYIAKEGLLSEFRKLVGGSGVGWRTGFESINEPKTIFHETIHTFTYDALNANEDVLTKDELSFKNKITEYFNIATASTDKYYYGLKNLDEFLSELSNREFIKFLTSISYENDSLPNITEELITALKNPFTRDFEIVSDLNTTDDEKYYFYKIRFSDGKERKEYFDNETEARAFYDMKNGSYNVNNLVTATLNEFIGFVRKVKDISIPEYTENIQN